MEGECRVTSWLASHQSQGMMKRDDEEGPLLRHHQRQRYGATEAPAQDSAESGYGAEDDVIEDVALIPSYRLLVAFIAMLGMVGSFASQSIMGASLLTMVGNVTNATSDTQWRYPWSTNTQTWILAAFFCGYYVIQIPAGLMTHCVGGRRVAVWGAVTLAVLQGVSIYVPRFGAPPFLVTMVLAGGANGCLYVPLLDVLARWAPPQESSTLVNLAVSGVGIGIAFVYGLSAYTSEQQLLGGWPFNFMALGVLLLVFAVLLWVLVSDNPEQSSFISARERIYILASQRRHNPTSQSPNTNTTSCIVTSGPVLAIAASQFGTDWIQYFFMTLFPLYLKHARGMHTDTADMLAGLPWMGFPACGFVTSRTVDIIRQKNIISTTKLRKIVDGFAKVVPMLLLVCMVCLPDDQVAALSVLYVLCIVLMSLEGSSWVANIVDLTSHYAGFVSSVAQVLSLPGSILLPLLVQLMTPHNTSEEWQHCILAMLGIVTISYIVYVIMGSSEPQTWESSNREESSDEVVQRSMGYCPQTDPLIEHMTCEETLTMFGRLRGIPESNLQECVQSFLEVLELGSHGPKRAGNLSGGMKRKLSTAVSLIGDPSVILLDEPSAGLDPGARRHLWDVLSSVRSGGRTLILTSHSMEECEALCTRVAIMVNGRMKCLGTTQHLKSRFGQGFTLSVKMGVEEDGQLAPAEPLVAFIQSHFPSAHCFDSDQGYAHIQVPDPNTLMSAVFRALESSKTALNVQEYSVHQTSLEQVFLFFTSVQQH